MKTTFDQPVILRRSPVWSRAVVWGIVGVATFSLGWACLAKVEEAVSATGQLQPTGSVRDIRVPLNGVVQTIHVKDGQRVKRGELLLTLDQVTAGAQLKSIKQIREALLAETQFYRQEMGNAGASGSNQNAGVKISPEMADLTKSRAALIAENSLYQAQLTGSTGKNLSPGQQLRLQSSQAELESRKQATRLEAAQLERQLAQNIVQVSTAQEILKINQGIFKDLSAVAKEGGVPRIQYLRQEQEVKNSQAKVEQLFEEQNRLRLAIAQARQKFQNTVALSQQEILTKMAENDKRVAEIDGQLNKAIVENEKKLSELNSQLKQAEQTWKYQEVRAPVDGIVFDLQASGQGYVATTSEPILKVVPEDGLTVEVFVPNKDIGFIKTKMPVDVRIDSFPFSEFGDIKGEVTTIGSDALPPTQVRQFYSFPVKISMNRQTLNVNGQEIPLQSGMSVSANIKIRQRSVITIFTDAFFRKVDSFKSIR
jgi:HlyD family secretion protein